MAKAIKAAGDRRTLDQIRADAVCDLLIDGTSQHVPASASGIRAQVVVTVPVLSLLDGPDAAHTGDAVNAAADLPAVEGVGPITLSKAREVCGGDGK